MFRSEDSRQQYGVIKASRPARLECFQVIWKSCSRDRYVLINQYRPVDRANDKGGARGIGLEVSKGLAEAGASVGLHSSIVELT